MDTTGVSGCGREDQHRPPRQERTWDSGLYPRGRGHSHAGERRPAGPGAFPVTARESRALGEAARLRTEHALCGWEWQGILSSTRGKSALPWRWGGCGPQRLQSICAQREACAESGLERPTGGTHHGGQRGEVEVATAAGVGRFTGPCSEREPPPQGMLGSLSQPLPSMTRKCAEAVMGVCNPFTSLVLDIYSL